GERAHCQRGRNGVGICGGKQARNHRWDQDARPLAKWWSIQGGTWIHPRVARCRLSDVARENAGTRRDHTGGFNGAVTGSAARRQGHAVGKSGRGGQQSVANLQCSRDGFRYGSGVLSAFGRTHASLFAPRPRVVRHRLLALLRHSNISIKWHVWTDNYSRLI